MYFQTIVGILGNKKVSPELFSAGSDLKREESSGQQSYDENKDSWPIGKPYRKHESRIQISGKLELYFMLISVKLKRNYFFLNLEI